MTDLPAGVTTGKVVGRFRLAVPDSVDAGSAPDAQADSGRIRFDPLLPYQRVTLPEPETVASSAQIYDLDSEGYLVDKQGGRGVWMLAGYYQVTFLLKKGRILPTTLQVTADHTELEPLDLSIATPPSGAAVLTQSQYSELSHRISVFRFPDHSDTSNRDAEDSHPMSAITGLLTALSDLEEAIGTVGSGGTVTATNAPTKPPEGASASYLVTSAVVWPAGLVWSTDPDGDTEPTITDAALVSLFTVGGTSYAVMGSTYPAFVVPDTTGPTAGTLGVVVGVTSADGTVTGASDETGLHAQPYSFRRDAGAWSAWQAGSTYEWTGLASEATYDFQHRVRDAAGNITEGAVVTDTTDPVTADTVDPTPGTLAASAITSVSFSLTVTGASDDQALDPAPYAFSIDGAPFSAWQSAATFDATGLTPETEYTCVHKVRDLAGNEATGAAIGVTTGASLEDTILALSPVTYWKMDETTGTTMTDSSGNGHHGTYVNSPTLGVTAGGALGSAVTFNGASQIATTTFGSGTTYQAVTMLVFIKTTDLDGHIISGQGSAMTAIPWAITVTGVGTSKAYVHSIGANGTSSATDSQQANDDQWHMLAGVVTPSTFEPYLDATQGTITRYGETTPGAIITRTSNVQIGARYTTPSVYYAGSLCHAAIFDKALTPAELASIYSASGLSA